ncbi:hypothetical protein GCM10007079_13180 [Nocardiopsis terrae]|nr:hypothetical protein GCM10007079_13180 [Nocardiopsis terrae]
MTTETGGQDTGTSQGQDMSGLRGATGVPRALNGTAHAPTAHPCRPGVRMCRVGKGFRDVWVLANASTVRCVTPKGENNTPMVDIPRPSADRVTT